MQPNSLFLHLIKATVYFSFFSRLLNSLTSATSSYVSPSERSATSFMTFELSLFPSSFMVSSLFSLRKGSRIIQGPSKLGWWLAGEGRGGRQGARGQGTPAYRLPFLSQVGQWVMDAHCNILYAFSYVRCLIINILDGYIQMMGSAWSGSFSFPCLCLFVS